MRWPVSSWRRGLILHPSERTLYVLPQDHGVLAHLVCLFSLIDSKNPLLWATFISILQKLLVTLETSKKVKKNNNNFVSHLETRYWIFKFSSFSRIFRSKCRVTVAPNHFLFLIVKGVAKNVGLLTVPAASNSNSIFQTKMEKWQKKVSVRLVTKKWLSHSKFSQFNRAYCFPISRCIF